MHENILEDERERAEVESEMDADPLIDKAKRIVDRRLWDLERCYFVER